MFYRQIFMSFLVMQAVFSMSQLQYFQLSKIVELYQKNQETQTFCPLALIFHLPPCLIFIAMLISTYPERMVFVTQYKQYVHISVPQKLNPVRFNYALATKSCREKFFCTPPPRRPKR